MLGILRAFVWLRWRVLMNSLERTGARDTIERFSLAIEQLGPIMAAVLMIPSAILLAGAGAYSGWALAEGTARPLPFEALRFLLLAACALTVIGPFLLPAAERTSPVRLLLLPISRRTLYLAQAATTLTDPWMLLMLPAVAALPAGLAVGGAWGAAVFAAGAGLVLMLVLIGLASLATSLIYLIVRNRRRAELLTLIFILVLPLAGMLPALLQGQARQATRERRAARVHDVQGWVHALQENVLPLVPSELYVRSMRAAAQDSVVDAIRPVVGLAAGAVLLHAAGLLVFGRMLDSPASTGSRRKASGRRTPARRIPGLSPGTSAVAMAQVRLALRTPRGRSTLLSPLMVFLMFGAMMWRTGSTAEFGFVWLGSGIALAVFASWVSLLAILPIAMNQFAIDGAGLTLAFLSPLDDWELLRGKAVGNAVIAGIPALFCTAAAAAIFPGASLSLWMSVPLGVAAAYLWVTPAAAALSAVFPRAVDLNSIGRGSNAHGAANFLGLLTCIAAGVSSLLVGAAATRVFGRPDATALLMLIWCAVSAALAHVLFIPVRALLARRRENLALIPERR